MSHHSVYKTDIKVDEKTLTRAIQKLADELGMKTRTHVSDAYGNITSVLIALYSSELPRGIGFSIDSSGNLLIEGDSWRYENKFAELSELAKNYINAYKTRMRVYQKFPNARVKTKIRNREVVMEVEI
ncbi:MAG TPA: hypothetical protein ENF47_02970 [Thermoprotei archaeon]|nr:hypothetical protein [Thermoprotei archaeon]